MTIWGSFRGRGAVALDQVKHKGAVMTVKNITQKHIKASTENAKEDYGPEWEVWAGEADNCPMTVG